MSRWLVLRLDAPLMSFGGIAVDERNPTMRFPGRSMMAGLLSNALGYDHREIDRVQALQDRLRHAVRADVEGEVHLDYQTVDLGDVGMRDGGWTTWGRVEQRAGGSARLGTHIRYRDYVTDAVYTVLVTLDPADDPPTLDEVRAAVERPARPLFLGRKACLPSGPLVDAATPFVDADDPVEALRIVSRARRPVGREEPMRWTGWVDADGSDPDRSMRIADLRDWANQVHTGRRWVREVSEPWEVARG